MDRTRKLPAEPSHGQSQLVRNLSLMAATIALVVALAAPLGFLWLSYRAEMKEAAVAARLHAAFVTQVASTSEYWQRDVPTLIEANLAPSELPELRTIRDAAGLEIARSGQPLARPILTGTAVVAGQQGPVGAVIVARSLRPMLFSTAIVGLFSAALGLAIYGTLRVLPLRALRRTLDALHREEINARVETEERLRIIFEHSIEGIVTFSNGGTILTCNPAGATIFGVPSQSLIGRNLTEWITPDESSDPLAPFAIGSREARVRRGDRNHTPIEFTVSEIRLTGELQLIAIFRDITERRQTQDRLAHLANYDSLTGLPNRALFRDRLAQAMERARRGQRDMGLMFLDLDRFKVVNDSLGHAVGDLLLQHVGELLTRSLREVDTVAHDAEEGTFTVSRLGGDEFTIIVEGLGGADQAAMIARRILNALNAPFVHDGREIYISASIGISLYPADDSDLDGLIRHTDMAMYRSKDLGRNTYNFYSDDMNASVAVRLDLEVNLRHALERDEFVLHYQPKANLNTGVITGVEALIRWNRPGQGTVAPDVFISILEDTGMIVPVGAWVIRTACAEVQSWDRLGLPPLSLAVNLSARQFRQTDLAKMITEVLSATGMAANRLELELTESLLMEDNALSSGVLAEFAHMGLRVAIDDFGTGHSSLSYLKRFSVDTLKIDRSFVRDTPDDAEDCAIATAIVALAHSLGLKVVAEGVENRDQLAFLRGLGCDEMQGYLLSRPLPAAQLVAWLQTPRGGGNSPGMGLKNVTGKGHAAALSSREAAFVVREF